MLTNTFIEFVVLTILAATQPAVARERWLERDNRAVLLHPRRFGQEQPAVIQKLSAACPGLVCGNLAGQAVTPLLATQPECSQQDHADAIIDASRQFDAATQANMIALAKEYRQAEKNTPPDFSTNPPAARNSVFCQKAPKNPELNGLVQAQDAANDPDLFFDPATKSTVRRGTQANTAPFGGGGAPAPVPPDEAPSPNDTNTPTATALPDTVEECVTEVTVTITGINPAATGEATIFTVGDPVIIAAPANPSPPANSGNIGDFGSCSVPQMEFGVGFDGRRETSFQPVDKVSYDHESAQDHAIITQFICDTLMNKCSADQIARDTCATAKVAAAAAAVGTGAQADAFNAVFGITTTFANVASVGGNLVPGTGNGGSVSPTNVPNTNFAFPTNVPNLNTRFTSPTTASFAPAATDTVADNGNRDGRDGGNDNDTVSFAPAATDTVADNGNRDGRDGGNDNETVSFAPAATDTAADNGNGRNDGNNNDVGNFGKCSVPQIKFGAGFDGRRETSFQPSDKVSFNHGSAQNIDIITRAICDTLTESCGADATAKATCITASAAASAAPAKTGAQADAFNKLFGINTNFVSVTEIDGQARVAGGGNGSDNLINTAVPVATITAAAFVPTQTPESKLPANTGSNIQWCSDNLGVVDAPVVNATTDGKVQVEGNAVFNSKQDAVRVVRSCDIQSNQCAHATYASGNNNGVNVVSCNAQPHLPDRLESFVQSNDLEVNDP